MDDISGDQMFLLSVRYSHLKLAYGQTEDYIVKDRVISIASILRLLPYNRGCTRAEVLPGRPHLDSDDDDGGNGWPRSGSKPRPSDWNPNVLTARPLWPRQCLYDGPAIKTLVLQSEGRGFEPDWVHPFPPSSSSLSRCGRPGSIPALVWQ